MIEIGSWQTMDEKSMIGLQVEDDMTWQLAKIWTDNYQSLKNAHGLQNGTTHPNVILFRPNATVDGF